MSEQAMMCPQCGAEMTCNGRVDTPPISWQMRGYSEPFSAYRWFCYPCGGALFDYTAEGRLLGKLGRMGEYYPVQTRTPRSEN